MMIDRQREDRGRKRKAVYGMGWVSELKVLYVLLMMAFFHLQLRYLYIYYPATVATTVYICTYVLEHRFCIHLMYGMNIIHACVCLRMINMKISSHYHYYYYYWHIFGIAFTIKLQFHYVFHLSYILFNSNGGSNILLEDSMNISCSNHLWVRACLCVFGLDALSLFIITSYNVCVYVV